LPSYLCQWPRQNPQPQSPWVKFAALALHAFLLARICMAPETRRPILAMLLLLPMVGTAFAAIDNSRAALMTYALVLSWTPVLLVAARDLLRRGK
ncbi:MAG TPA: hypothetical protein PKX06_16795, partial [Phenylobacterium sp.]|nr:hypothetical protein [Phenylobacterium sp.]